MPIVSKWPRLLRNCLCCNYSLYIFFPITIILAILQLKSEERWSVLDNFTSLEVEHGKGWTDTCTKFLILFIAIREQRVHSMVRRCSLYLLTDFFFVPLQEPFWEYLYFLHYRVNFSLTFFPGNWSIIDSPPALY
jgi:hypothetical protein